MQLNIELYKSTSLFRFRVVPSLKINIWVDFYNFGEMVKLSRLSIVFQLLFFEFAF
jgi:hypothetical protein